MGESISTIQRSPRISTSHKFAAPRYRLPPMAWQTVQVSAEPRLSAALKDRSVVPYSSSKVSARLRYRVSNSVVFLHCAGTLVKRYPLFKLFSSQGLEEVSRLRICWLGDGAGCEGRWVLILVGGWRLVGLVGKEGVHLQILCWSPSGVAEVHCFAKKLPFSLFALATPGRALPTDNENCSPRSLTNSPSSAGNWNKA